MPPFTWRHFFRSIVGVFEEKTNKHMYKESLRRVTEKADHAMIVT